jgi:LuxR family quorum-sensing system transcriptional regulator CciR
MQDNFRIGDFIDKTIEATDSSQVVAILKQALQEWGFPYMACGSFGGISPEVVMDYPESWKKHYAERNYLDIDPVVTRAFNSRTPYYWDDLSNLSSKQKLLFLEAKDAGLLHGLTVPIHGLNGEVFVTGIASPHEDVDTKRSLTVAGILITQAYNRMMSIKYPQAPEPQTTLSSRESECLVWAARGKTSWEIGGILSISENTVNFHIKNAMTKLEASTRLMAILKATNQKLIAP